MDSDGITYLISNLSSPDQPLSFKCSPMTVFKDGGAAFVAMAPGRQNSAGGLALAASGHGRAQAQCALSAALLDGRLQVHRGQGRVPEVLRQDAGQKTGASE